MSLRGCTTLEEQIEILKAQNNMLRGEIRRLKESARERFIELEDIKVAMETQSRLLSGRAGKLLKKHKRFIVIAHDEPYYKSAYGMIRAEERRKGTWTDGDEAEFKASTKKN